MQETSRREWLEVCAEAAIAEDPERFEELIEAINEILRREQRRLDTPQPYNIRAAP
jgi:hypothetical protein